MKKRTLLIMVLLIVLSVSPHSLTYPSGSEIVKEKESVTYMNNDWVVNTTEVRINETIILSGNLTIQANGNLTFRNIILKMNCSSDGEYCIEVQNDGAFYIYDDSNITSNNISYHYTFRVREKARMIMGDSNFYYCGYNHGSDWSNNGLYIESDNVTIDNCTIANGGSAGILIFYSSPLIINSRITSNPSWNIVCKYSAPSIIGNTITKGNIGIQICDNSNPLIKNNSIFSNYDDGIAIGFSSNPTIINTTVEGDNFGISCIGGTTSYPLIINSTLKGYNYYDLSLSMSYITLVNSVFNKNKVVFWSGASDANVTIRWYANIHVGDLVGNPIQSANIIIENAACADVFNGTTDANGYCKWIPLTEYVQFDLNDDNDGEDAGEKIFYSPYNITVTKDSYTTEYVNITMNESKEITITLEKVDSDPPHVVDHSPVENNIPIDTNITVTFNETMNQTSAENAFIILPIVTGDIGWDGNTMIFTPTNTLSYNTTYNVTITTDAMDLVGNHLTSNYSWVFTTEKEPNQPPIANFTYTPINPTDLELVYFTDDSTDDDGTVISWSWEFGDGVTSTLQNPSHQYTDDGTYYVNLTVTDDVGESSIVCQKSITVLNVKPTASFTYSPSNPTDLQTITFTSTSTDPDGTITSYYWYFGDGNTSTLQNPTHQYEDNGTYYVNLTVIDNDGATNTTIQIITVLNVPPVAGFTFSPSNPSTADIIHFNSTISYDSDGDIVSYFWVFGDGTNIIIENPTHQYNHPETYTVTLSATDNDGVSNTTSQTITVSNQQPTVEITYPSNGATIKNTVIVTGISNDPDESIVMVKIKINSGSWVTVTGTTSWAYSLNTKSLNNGQHTISVRSYDGTDYSNVESVTVNVNNTQGGGGFIPGFGCLLFIGAFIITVLLCYERKKRIYGGR